MKNPVIVNLVGIDGNAYSIMGAWKSAAHKAGWSSDEMDTVLKEAMSDDYNHLLATILENSETPDEDDEHVEDDYAFEDRRYYQELD